MDESRPGAGPVVSTTGFEGEAPLRRLRRRTVADVVVRHLSQTGRQPASLLETPIAHGMDEVARERLVPGAVDVLRRLPLARLVVSGGRLTLAGDDLLGAVLDAGNESRWPEAVLSAQRVAIGGSRGARVRFARTDGGGDIEVFTTRPDTLFGASFVAVSPNHPAARQASSAQLAAFRREWDSVGDGPEARVGVPLDLSVRHPLVLDRELPVWLANFVVDTYGTGAAGGCPACDQRDLDFARHYGLPVSSIVCPPGMDPATFQVGASAYAGDGTIINSGFLSGLPVAEAIDAAIAHLVEVGRGTPTVQYRRRPMVLAEEAPSDGGDLRHLGRSWRFISQFLAAAALVVPAAGTSWRPHTLHVTVVEAATRHLLDARILVRALEDARAAAYPEPWEEILLVGDVPGPSGDGSATAPAAGSDALRLALLADTPPDRELDWSDNRYAAAQKFVEGAEPLFGSPATAGGTGRAEVAAKVAKAAASLDSALRRRRTNTAVAAMREIVTTAAGPAAGAGLDSSAQALVAALVYPLLPELAARGLAAAGAPANTPPAWPELAEHVGETGSVELAVQINGKRRGVVRVARDAGEDAVLAAVRGDASLSAHLGEKPVRRTVVVPNRLVNLVV